MIPFKTTTVKASNPTRKVFVEIVIIFLVVYYSQLWKCLSLRYNEIK
jgi:hypothetical protein